MNLNLDGSKKIPKVLGFMLIVSIAIVFFVFSLIEFFPSENIHANIQSARDEGLQQGITIEALLSQDGVSLYDLDEAGLIHISQLDMLDALEYYAQSRNSGYESWSQEEKAAKETAVELYKKLEQIKIKLPPPDTTIIVREPEALPPPAE